MRVYSFGGTGRGLDPRYTILDCLFFTVLPSSLLFFLFLASLLLKSLCSPRYVVTERVVYIARRVVAQDIVRLSSFAGGGLPVFCRQGIHLPSDNHRFTYDINCLEA